MVSLTDLDQDGELWRVSIPLTASMSSVTLVTPKPYFAGNVNIANQYSVNRQYGIVLMGFSYNFYTSGASSITLNSYDPWIAEGTITETPIWSHPVGAAGYYSHSAHNLIVPLSPADRRPDASPEFANGATLRITTASNLTAGSILLWGIHTQKDFGRYGLTGSPADFT